MPVILLKKSLKILLILTSIFTSLYSQSTIRDIPLTSESFNRVNVEQGSFAEHLRNMSLLPPGSDVLNYKDGIFKSGQDTAVAYVVDLDIRGRRLEQCMDILVRLYAEYLWKSNRLGELRLPLPGGYWLKWVDWREGYRPIFKGIDVSLKKTSHPDTSLKTYQSYLNMVYSEAHTQQFYHAYQSLDRNTVEIGDIVIRKGSKGHAVMIVDLAKNENGEYVALVGNGDTPACQFFLLNHRKDDVWIPLRFENETLALPLKREISWDGLRRFDLPREN
jgi:hypothetical protein